MALWSTYLSMCRRIFLNNFFLPDFILTLAPVFDSHPGWMWCVINMLLKSLWIFQKVKTAVDHGPDESCAQRVLLQRESFLFLVLIFFFFSFSRPIFQTFEKHDGACQREQYFRTGSALRELHDLRLLNGGGGGGGGSFVFTVKYRFLAVRTDGG